MERMIPAARIPLSSGAYAVVDPLDASMVVQFNWYEMRSGRTSYAVRTTDDFRMHRLIVGGSWPEVDHQNGNGLDNRRCNLRPANREQNSRNTRKKTRCSNGSKPTSKYKGVGLHAVSGLWRCRIRSGNGVTISLGYYRDEVAAARAYDDAARKIHGAYATLNFPRPGERSGI